MYIIQCTVYNVLLHTVPIHLFSPPFSSLLFPIVPSLCLCLCLLSSLHLSSSVLDPSSPHCYRDTKIAFSFSTAPQCLKASLSSFSSFFCPMHIYCISHCAALFVHLFSARLCPAKTAKTSAARAAKEGANERRKGSQTITKWKTYGDKLFEESSLIMQFLYNMCL